MQATNKGQDGCSGHVLDEDCEPPFCEGIEVGKQQNHAKRNHWIDFGLEEELG